jgi:hypothetical protein
MAEDRNLPMPAQSENGLQNAGLSGVRKLKAK